MPVRPANKDDIRPMAKVLAASFGPDRLFQVMFPHQKEHPDAFVRAFEEHLWLSWYDYKKILMVSYHHDNAEPEDKQQQQRASTESNSKGVLSTINSRQVVTGVAEWERVGPGWESIYGVWGRWDPRLWMKPILGAFYNFRRRIFPNRAAAQPTAQNPAPLTYWSFVTSIIPFTAAFFSAPARQIHWSLENLAVHPDYQGKGYGRELVERGLEISKTDPMGDLPACVIAADGKEGFYQKNGFPELVGWASKTVDDEGRDNPLKANGVGGGAVLWTR